MKFEHRPVLLKDVIEGLCIKEDGVYLDCTVGGGGHAAGICEKLSEKGSLIGIDRDADAVSAAGERLKDFPCRVTLFRSEFSKAGEVLSAAGVKGLDGVLLDLGVSSFQLDEAKRGFSYMKDGPLDMRMDRESGITAEDVVNGYSEKELSRVLRDYGEERYAANIARLIVKKRRAKRIEGSVELSEIIKEAVPAPARRSGPHPAKRSFQAIRIEVNDELGELSRSLGFLIDMLFPKGRIAVISFHSLEDRIVKEVFQKRLNPCVCPPDFPVCVCGRKPDVKKVTGKPITASEEEILENPRSRSAKLRILEKL